MSTGHQWILVLHEKHIHTLEHWILFFTKVIDVLDVDWWHVGLQRQSGLGTTQGGHSKRMLSSIDVEASVDMKTMSRS